MCGLVLIYCVQLSRRSIVYRLNRWFPFNMKATEMENLARVSIKCNLQFIEAEDLMIRFHLIEFHVTID